MRDASQCSTSAILIRPIDKIVKLVKAFYQKKKLLGPGEVVGWEMAPHKRDGNRIRHRMPNTASARSTHRNGGLSASMAHGLGSFRLLRLRLASRKDGWCSTESDSAKFDFSRQVGGL